MSTRTRWFTRALFFLLVCYVMSAVPGWTQPRSARGDPDALVTDIPEPPDAGEELTSPIPLIYEFMGGIMGGDQDRCLVNFHVRTFLKMLFGAHMDDLGQGEELELYSYQTQVQRNEFRYLSKIMNRLAKDAKLHYSNPRFNGKTQAKVVVKIKTTTTEHEFVIYARYVEEKWQIYDYILNNRRFSDAFKSGLSGWKPQDYLANLRPVYNNNLKYKSFSSPDYGFSVSFPEPFKIREKVSQNLLYSVAGFESHFLMHVQGAVYQKPRDLKQAALEIRETIMPFRPKLFDQWKSDLAGTEAGQVIFQFEKNGKLLFTHMVIIPLAEKLVVLNFYHNSFQLLKNMTNIREKMLSSLKFASIPTTPAEITIPADDASLPGDNKAPTELQPYDDNPPSDQTPPPPPDNGDDEVPPPPPPPDDNEDEIPPPPPDEGGDQPPPPPIDEEPRDQPPNDQGTQNGQGGDDVPPPPPADDGDEEIPPPPPDEGPGDAPPPPPSDDGGKDVDF